jgi:histidinol-phosphate aminotransferase
MRMIDAGRAYLVEAFGSLGLTFAPSRANFLLVDVGRNAVDVYRRRLREGVIVRPMTSFGLDNALRVTVGTPEENRRVITALRTVLAEARRA